MRPVNCFVQTRHGAVLPPLKAATLRAYYVVAFACAASVVTPLSCPSSASHWARVALSGNATPPRRPLSLCLARTRLSTLCSLGVCVRAVGRGRHGTQSELQVSGHRGLVSDQCWGRATSK
jgi:hypothetical protein